MIRLLTCFPPPRSASLFCFLQYDNREALAAEQEQDGAAGGDAAGGGCLPAAEEDDEFEF